MKILFLVSRFPFPLEKGDKLRAYQHLQNMHASGHHIVLVALSDAEVSETSISIIKKFCTEIYLLRLNYIKIFFNLINSFFRKLPLHVGYFYSVKHNKKIAEIINLVEPDIIYCQLIRTALFVKNINNIPKIIDYQDAFSKGTEQRMFTVPFFLKPVFMREYKLLKLFEEKTYRWFSDHFIISNRDKESMSFNEKQNLTVLPNGIDTYFYKPVTAAKEYEITFVGNMNYPPNIDASRFLIKEIMPMVWKVIPEVKVQLAGADPGFPVKELASAKVKVTGWVEDIRSCYSNTQIFIAPMRIGTGLQNKLLEAMAMKIPCVTTPLSFEPLEAKKNRDILVGSTANELSAHLINLLTDCNLQNEIALNGFNFVVEHYSMSKSRAILNSVIERTIKSR